jgi:hypothetical protein
MKGKLHFRAESYVTQVLKVKLSSQKINIALGTKYVMHLQEM